MSSANFLEKLLDGVAIEWSELGKIGEFVRGKRFVKTDIVSEGTPCIHYGELYTHFGICARETKSFLCEDLASKLRFAQPGDVVIVSAGETIEDIGNATAWLGNEDVVIHDACFAFKSKLNPVYVSYFLRTKSFKNQIKKSISSGKISSINSSGLGRALIPIPCPDNPKKSLEIQAEIVRILDAMTAHTAELTAELTARKKQYNYYRDKLLSFEDCEAEWKTLGDIGDVRMCKRILKNETKPEGDVPFYKIGTFGKKADAYISRYLFEDYKRRYSFPQKGDVLISASGTIGRTVIYDGEPAYFQDSNIVWLENDESVVTNKYLWHFYKIAKWAVSEGGTIDRLYNDNIKKTKILVPYPSDPKKSLAEQARVVAILDKFDALTNSITEGLPREIELRQKQYAYYRDLLLSFPKPEAASAASA